MNTFQKAIAGLFKIPTAKPRQRGYAGGRGNGTGLSGWIAPQASADNDLWSALRTLIARSRSLYNDDSNVQAAVDELVATVVDDGLKLQSHVGRRRGKGLDLAVNQRIEDAFNAWANNPDWCDVAGLHTFWQMQRIVQHNRLVDGGILIRCVKRRFSNSPVPFALELIDVDLLDDRTALINSRKNDIRMGIEVDGWRRPVAYWLFDSHPADLWGTPGQSYYSRPVSASEIIHVFNRQGWRAGQTRGVPALHAAILKARNLLGFEESEIVKARVQSCITAFVESEFSDTEPIPVDDEDYPIRQLFPGAVEYLSPGQRISSFDASSPNPNAPAFIKHFQRAIARVLGMSSYSVTGDLNDANYSSLREGTLKEWRRIRIMRDELSADFLHPIFVRWLDAAVLSGALSLPQDYEGNRARYLKDNWFGRPMPWFDPTKDTSAIEKEIALGLTTQTEVLAERGKDINDVLATKAQEKEMMKSYGLDESDMGEDGKTPQPEPDENAPLMEGMQAVRFLSEALERSYKVIHGDRQLPPPETVTAEFVEPTPNPDTATPTEDDDLTTINLNFNGFPFDVDGMDGMNGDRSLPEPIEDFPLLRGFTDAHPFRDRKIKPRKKKNCSQGHQCGFSCVAKGKVCKADMTLAQLKAHNAAKRAERREKAKAAKGGGVSAALQHKPFMTEEEATQYTKDSVWADRTFFHGTSKNGAKEITTNGIDISKVEATVFGPGFYMGATSKDFSGLDIASEYADGRGGRILEMKVMAKKPLEIENIAFHKMIEDQEEKGVIPKPIYDPVTRTVDDKAYKDGVRNYLKGQGYDALYISDYDYAIAFDANQVAIYGNYLASSPPKVSKDKVKLEQERLS